MAPEDNASGLGEFRYRLDATEESRFLTPEAGGDGLVTPAVVVLAEAAGRREVRTSTATEPELAVPVDVLERRALVGPRDLLRSTLVDLLYLHGRYSPHVEKFDERVGLGGERVVTWRLRDAP